MYITIDKTVDPNDFSPQFALRCGFTKKEDAERDVGIGAMCRKTVEIVVINHTLPSCVDSITFNNERYDIEELYKKYGFSKLEEVISHILGIK